MEKIDFKKNADGLVPAIVQDFGTRKVLMLGYMNEEAVDKTLKTKKVTFYSRSRKKLWTKGEESGNYLNLVSMKTDCDADTLLVMANPEGPVCHTGSDTCWDEVNTAGTSFLGQLEEVIEERKNLPEDARSYVASLFRKGINAIAQKVGEEAVETIIEAKDSNDALFLNESADLLFHYLVLLNAKGYRLKDVEELLEGRHRGKAATDR